MILGGSGMLGHRLWMDLSTEHDVWVTVRSPAAAMPDLPGVDRSQIRENVDVIDFATEKEFHRVVGLCGGAYRSTLALSSCSTRPRTR